MRLTILPQNPRLPDEPMMTLIAGQPNAAATVDQCEAWWSTRKFVRPEAAIKLIGRTIAETWAAKS